MSTYLNKEAIKDYSITQDKFDKSIVNSITENSKLILLIKQGFLENPKHPEDVLVRGGVIPIPFEDDEVKKILVKKYGSNGEITYEQALNLNLDWMNFPTDEFCNNTKIRSFKEFRFFNTPKVGSRANLDKAFVNCTNLKEVELPASATEIGGSSFYNCTSLEEIDIPSTITKISMYAFKNCKHLKNVILHEGLNEIETRQVFAYCTNLVHCDLPDSLTILGEEAFRFDENLEMSKLPSNLITLGGSAFQRCKKVDFTEIPNTVTGSLGSHTFAETNVSFTKLPDSITGIEFECFYYCHKLQLTELSANITAIGVGAFGDCPLIKELTINAVTPPTLGSVFPTTIATIYVPDNSLEAYKAATNWNNMSDRIKGISEKASTTTT